MITRAMIEEACKGSLLELALKVHGDLATERLMRDSEYWQWLEEKDDTKN